MYDHRLAALTPLGRAAPAESRIGPVTIREVCDVAMASVMPRAGRAVDVAAAAKTAGIPLPGPGLGEWATPWGAFWTGPDSWIIEAPFASHEDIVPILRRVIGDAASITEQTDGWARFDVILADPAALFERLCAVDLARTEPGAAVRTVIEHLGCFLIRRAADRIVLITPRSSAASFLHALETAARCVF